MNKFVTWAARGEQWNNSPYTISVFVQVGYNPVSVIGQSENRRIIIN